MVLSWPIWVVPVAALVLGPLVLELTYMYYEFVAKALNAETTGRGLWEFWSATYGDPVLVTAIALLAALAYRDFAGSGVSFTRHRWLRWAPLVFSVVATMLLTIPGLTNEVNANWTQPKGSGLLGLPLHLNLPGFIHAAFFVLVMWWFAEFSLRVIIVCVKMAKSSEELLQENAGAITGIFVKTNFMLMLGTVFGLLLVRDYWGQITNPDIKHTWVWFLAAGVSFVAAGVVDAIYFTWVRYHYDACVSDVRDPVKRGIKNIVLTWLVPATVLAAVALGVTIGPLIVEVKWMALTPFVLAILGAVNVWSEVFWFQNRKTSTFGWIVVVASGLSLLAGFCTSLLLIATTQPVDSLEALAMPFLGAVCVDFLGGFLAIGMSFGLARYEWFSETYQTDLADCQTDGRCFGAETPEHDIIQNLAMLFCLFALLPLFVVAYEVLGWPVIQALDSSSQISLLFGYSGVAATITAFPLYNNMAYVRDLEAQTKVREAEGRETDKMDDYLTADKNFSSVQTVVTGVLAVIVVMSLWVTIVDRIAQAAEADATSGIPSHECPCNGEPSERRPITC